MKENMLLVTQTGAGTVFSHRNCAITDILHISFFWDAVYILRGDPTEMPGAPIRSKPALGLGDKTKNVLMGQCGTAFTCLGKVTGKGPAVLHVAVARSRIYLS